MRFEFAALEPQFGVRSRFETKSRTAVNLAPSFGIIWVLCSSSTQADDGAKPLAALSLPQD